MNPEIEIDDCFLDLKRLNDRTSISVRKWRDILKAQDAPPYYRVGGKILLYWPEAREWIRDKFKVDNDWQKRVDEIVKEVLAKLNI